MRADAVTSNPRISVEPETISSIAARSLIVPSSRFRALQFAIGINGSFYLGGGGYYNNLGSFQGVFTLHGDATTSSADGRVYVYDEASGFQEYQDASVVPGPSTCALAIGVSCAFTFRRRWQRA